MELNLSEKQILESFKNEVINELDKVFKNDNSEANYHMIMLTIDNIIDNTSLKYRLSKNFNINPTRLNQVINYGTEVLRIRFREMF